MAVQWRLGSSGGQGLVLIVLPGWVVCGRLSAVSETTLRLLFERRLTRLLLALPVAMFASSLTAASDNPLDARAASELPARVSSQPKWLSKFDYLVLASMSDSMQPFTMAGYLNSGAAYGCNAVHAAGHPINKGNLQCHL